MEFIAYFMLTAIIIFLSFWIRNMIIKIKNIAKERANFNKLMYLFSEELSKVLNNPYYSGDQNLMELRHYTEGLIRYIQTDQIYEEIKFLYSEEESENTNNV